MLYFVWCSVNGRENEPQPFPTLFLINCCRYSHRFEPLTPSIVDCKTVTLVVKPSMWRLKCCRWRFECFRIGMLRKNTIFRFPNFPEISSGNISERFRLPSLVVTGSPSLYAPMLIRNVWNPSPKRNPSPCPNPSPNLSPNPSPNPNPN